MIFNQPGAIDLGGKGAADFYFRLLSHPDAQTISALKLTPELLEFLINDPRCRGEALLLAYRALRKLLHKTNKLLRVSVFSRRRRRYNKLVQVFL